MKKTIKLILVSTMVLLTAFAAVSCSNVANNDNNDFTTNNSTDNTTSKDNSVNLDKPYLSYEEAVDKLGNRSKIYNTTDYLPSRFYSGQILEGKFKGNIKNKVVFDAKLVEYNSLDKDIKKYVDNIPDSEADSWMHQGYDIEFISGKTYVELSSYTDLDNNKIMQFEIRVFKGDFWNHKNEAGWYAKSILLSPDLKIDIRRGKNIKTGEDAHYVYPYAKYDSEFALEDLNRNENKYFTGHNGYNITEEMLKLGTNPQPIGKPTPNITCNNKDIFMVSKLYRYDSLNKPANDKYNELKNNAGDPWHLWSNYNEKINEDCRYIEVICDINRQTDEITSCQLRFLIPIDQRTNKESHETIGIVFEDLKSFKKTINECQDITN